MTMFGLAPKMRVFVPPEQYFNDLNDEGVLNMYNTASVYVSTSSHEGFNLTALEAMACECPVVKTRDEGSDEYTDDGGNCLVGKDAVDLTNKILTVLGSVNLSKTLSQNGLFTAQRYTWDAAIDRLEKILLA
jgi:glycosyltransferase involved in cell wall biosynthesis